MTEAARPEVLTSLYCGLAFLVSHTLNIAVSHLAVLGWYKLTVKYGWVLGSA